jgi:hypothetical protein
MPIQMLVHQIVIDIPSKESEPFMSLSVQRRITDEDGNVVQTVNRERLIYRRLSEVATEFHDFVDPLTGKTENASVAGVGAALTASVAQWLAEEYDVEIDENGQVWLD